MPPKTPEDALLEPATEQARLLRRRELSAVELCSAALARIARENPRLWAFVGVMDASARTAAAGRDREIARAHRGGAVDERAGGALVGGLPDRGAGGGEGDTRRLGAGGVAAAGGELPAGCHGGPDVGVGVGRTMPAGGGGAGGREPAAARGRGATGNWRNEERSAGVMRWGIGRRFVAGRSLHEQRPAPSDPPEITRRG